MCIEELQQHAILWVMRPDAPGIEVMADSGSSDTRFLFMHLVVVTHAIGDVHDLTAAPDCQHQQRKGNIKGHAIGYMRG